MVPSRAPWMRRRRRRSWTLLARPEVRAVFVIDGTNRLVGVVTRKTLVREVVAPGRSPTETPVGEIAEEAHYTIDSDMDLEAAFHFLEETTRNGCRSSRTAASLACSLGSCFRAPCRG